MLNNERLSEATAEATEEFYSWVENLPLDEAMTALRGIKQYQKDIQAERDIRAGHLRFED